jgi:CRISPR-associated endonuclease/helicase Cas3
MTAKSHEALFGAIAGCPPHAWQQELASDQICRDRLIRIPTGFGKTLGVLSAWLARSEDTRWPRRLVWCLPMRVLVEQTESEVRGALAKLGLLWGGEADHRGLIGVHVLMGGINEGQWMMYPDERAVLIGTQDMLLSRALNRGYGASRASWPFSFGLLNQDVLWVMDEVQLMDVGLATSTLLQQFRRDDAAASKELRPARTWWMSATLQPSWLGVAPETKTLPPSLPQTRIEAARREGVLWDVTKPVELVEVAEARLAERVAREHIDAGRGQNGPTLVVLNTVRQATALHATLSSSPVLKGTDLRIVHSRFRGADRAAWRGDFLNRKACVGGVDRIIIATQVIEAGVDISAAVLITALAPWSSLVQRFGRAARWGGAAKVIVFDALGADEKVREKNALPYDVDELEAAAGALRRLADVSPRSLEAFEEDHANRELVESLYPYDPKHLLMRHELEDLFDTAPDLSGADIDVSRFIRSGDERDLSVFWEHVDAKGGPHDITRPARDALCAVPFLGARDWLCGKETSSSKKPRLDGKKRAWVWDYLDRHWRLVERKDLYPGAVVLVAADVGGYAAQTGWDPESKVPVTPVPPAELSPEDEADGSEDDEALSAIPRWQTIASHGKQVGASARTAATLIDDDRFGRLLDLAGRWHDAGKALAPFQNSIKQIAGHPQRRDLAKALKEAWVPSRKMYPEEPPASTQAPRGKPRFRSGYRHELASTLALFAVLMRHNPMHPALLGPWRELFAAMGKEVVAQDRVDVPATALEREILDLDAADFELVAYLVCSHHGKVRVTWHASPADQKAVDDVLRIRGVRDGEPLPPVLLTAADGSAIELPPSTLRLDASAAGLNPVTGRGWTERVLGLLQRHGPFAIGYLEALLRASDQRSSHAPTEDPLLAGGGQ